MLALCLMLSKTYYAQNYAGIIGLGLPSLQMLLFQEIPFWKFSLKNHWYWTHSLSIIILSYLLAFVQLTWQIYNGWVSPVYWMFFMECINIQQAYIRGWVEAVGVGDWWKMLRKTTQMVEFRVAMTSTCIHKGPIFYLRPRQMSTDSGSSIRPHYQI